MNEEHFIEDDESEVDLNPEAWRPTPEQFERYKAREVELARGNIRLILSKDFLRSPERLRSMTLHSPNTLLRAFQEVLWERAGVCPPIDIDIEMREVVHLGTLRVPFIEALR